MIKEYQRILSVLKKEYDEKASQTYNSNILLIDGLNNYIRNWVVNTDVNQDGVHVGGITGFLRSMTKMIEMFKPTRIIITFDGKNGSTRRRAYFPEYKMHRGHGMKLNKRFDFINEEDETKQKVKEFARLYEYLKQLPVTLVMIDNIEADDVIGYICQEFAENEDVRNINIISTDKDFFQLITEKVTVYNPVKKKLYNNESVLSEYNIHPKNFILFKSIIGDKSDNIPGVAGIQIKTVNKNFPQLREETIYNIDSLADKTIFPNCADTVYKKLADNLEQIKRNYRLNVLAKSNISTQSAIKIIDRFKYIPDKKTYFGINALSLQDRLNFDTVSYFEKSFTYINAFCK